MVTVWVFENRSNVCESEICCHPRTLVEEGWKDGEASWLRAGRGMAGAEDGAMALRISSSLIQEINDLGYQFDIWVPLETSSFRTPPLCSPSLDNLLPAS